MPEIDTGDATGYFQRRRLLSIQMGENPLTGRLLDLRRRAKQVIRKAALSTVVLLALLILEPPLQVQAAVFNCIGGDTDCLIAAIDNANTNSESDTINLIGHLYVSAREQQRGGSIHWHRPTFDCQPH